MRRIVPIVFVFAFLGGMVWVGLPWFRLFLAYQELRGEALPARLPVPVRGLTPSRIADTYGAPRGQDRQHQGLDLFAARGQAVLSTTRGMVTRVAQDRLGGNVVYVMGPGGYQHYYAHLERFGTFGQGDWVKAGDVLGFVGDSGNAKGTPPHLHYGLYTPQWKAVNPYPYLTGK